MNNLNFYLKAVFLGIVVYCIGSIIFYIINSERKIKELEEEKMALEITNATLEISIKEQKKIMQNIYHKNTEQAKIIKQNAEKLTILNTNEDTENKIKNEFTDFNKI